MPRAQSIIQNVKREKKRHYFKNCLHFLNDNSKCVFPVIICCPLYKITEVHTKRHQYTDDNKFIKMKNYNMTD